ncbi:hypothetical protein DFQ27_001489 [Actinomortierella ambigua]|uniref:Uncharacterized protein n=1 Tax=Actinomortierella ambigua TaxID=1343610 RepID=A0A9P6QIP2_9FUNG|nr:hypothetical protein DFQ27_001489 [Actinomortierella ambigua]
MRSTTVLLAIASLAATVLAHGGEDHGAASSPCLTNPANATCSTYTFDTAALNKDVDAICSVSSFLPGCSLSTSCRADPSLPQSQCHPLTVLATLCTAPEDKNLTATSCATSYNAYCGATSVIPQCKNQTAFPGLPSGKIVTGTVYSICLDMPGMKGCSICPAPDATGYSKCDEVKAWSDLCLDMPDMSQCPPFNAMCKNTAFGPFCDASYKAPVNNGTAPGGNGTASPSPSTPTPTGGSGNGSGAMALTSSLSMTAVLTVVVAGISSMVL